MRTAKERAAQIKQMIHDPDVGTLEAYMLLWHWFTLEYAFYRRAKADKAVEKAGTRYNNDIEVVNFRKKLADL